MTEYLVHFDGSIGPSNPDVNAAYGFTVHKDGILLHEEAGKLPYGPLYSNNSSEFYAFSKGVEHVLPLIVKGDRFFARGDSQLVVNVMRKKWGAKDEKIYYPCYVLANNVLKEVYKRGVPVSIDWVPRSKNSKADELSKYNRK